MLSFFIFYIAAILWWIKIFKCRRDTVYNIRIQGARRLGYMFAGDMCPGVNAPLAQQHCVSVARRDLRSVSTTRVHGPSWRVSKKYTRVLGPSTRPVNSGSGNRPLLPAVLGLALLHWLLIDDVTRRLMATHQSVCLSVCLCGVV